MKIRRTIKSLFSSLRAGIRNLFDEGPKLDACPECGGTKFFRGYGVCGECQIF